MEKTKFCSVGFRVLKNNEKSRFVSGVSGFGFCFLGFEYTGFGFRLLDVGYMGLAFGFWMLNIQISVHGFWIYGFWALDIWLSVIGLWIGFHFELILNRLGFHFEFLFLFQTFVR
ncbi:uncharacterized protein OCT59_022355 [Rhizophagus irregularis]|uniref:uncharacterized protein n=1 Tax=Rhizophagus irregularis TaxID=588596 RepID=UPI003328491D|nr:hypothetical protein OCT59_022355 [Rhizophagus irregularis]